MQRLFSLREAQLEGPDYNSWNRPLPPHAKSMDQIPYLWVEESHVLQWWFNHFEDELVRVVDDGSIIVKFESNGSDEYFQFAAYSVPSRDVVAMCLLGDYVDAEGFPEPEEWYESENYDLRMAAARSPYTSSVALERLVVDEDEEIRMIALRHPNFPEHLRAMYALAE